MRPGRPIRALATAALTLLVGSGALLAAGSAAHAAPAAGAPTPAHLFAPYFEAYAGNDPATLAQQSGAKYLTMAFVQAATKGSCTVYWDGDTSTPIGSTFASSIATIRANGGDVIPSFGGFTADNTGTEIADSCTNVSSIAAAYENIVTTYNVTRIDLDTEDNSLTNTAGIDRRNKAIKMVEDWAAANGRTVQFTYTLPSTPTGLASSGLNVLKNAVTNNARIDTVNIMTFDYYDGATHQMASDTKTAAAGLEKQLANLYPGKTAAQLWAMIGVTEMIGIDDYGAAETFTTGDASTVLSWAQTQGINQLSFWALQRDNGGCVGTAGSDSCSGISQSTWFFSQAFAPFTSGSTPPPTNDFSLTVSPGTASIAQGGSTSATVGTAVTAGGAQTVNLTLSGNPAGMTVNLSPTSVTTGNSATLSVSTTSSTPAGTYQINVTGTAPAESHSGTFTVTVTGTGGGGGSIVNGGFETGSLSPWTCQSTVAVVASPAHSGTHAARVSPTGSATGECDQSVTLAANHSYTLTAWVQGNYAFVGVTGGASASTWTSASGWTKLTVPFTTGANGAVSVFVHGWYSQGDVFADDFSIS